jgi:hypothetical protein
MSEPEIILPGEEPRRSSRSGLSDAQLDQLASLLDDAFHIPGTALRFGLDPIIGLVPGLGDIISGLLSFLMVFAAWQRGLPKIAISRMVVNIGIDTLIGSIPIAGDLFDAVWKSNRMNYNLLVRYRGERRRKYVLLDWLFFLLLAVVGLALMLLPVAVLYGLYHLLRR